VIHAVENSGSGVAFLKTKLQYDRYFKYGDDVLLQRGKQKLFTRPVVEYKDKKSVRGLVQLVKDCQKESDETIRKKIDSM
jgi:hypothetical protein